MDDFPDDLPVTPEEVDVIERWLGDVLEDMFGPDRIPAQRNDADDEA